MVLSVMIEIFVKGESLVDEHNRQLEFVSASAPVILVCYNGDVKFQILDNAPSFANAYTVSHLAREFEDRVGKQVKPVRVYAAQYYRIKKNN